MPDDILDAAQKAINDAADAGVSSGTPTGPVSPPPSAPPAEPEPMPMTPPPSVPEPLPEQPKEKSPEPAPMPTPTPSASAPKEEASAVPLTPDIVPGMTPDSTIVPPVKPAKPASVDKPKRKFPGAIVAVVITLLLALPVAVYYISQQNQQLADVRSRATGSNYSCTHTSDCTAGFCNLSTHTCQVGTGGGYACDFTSPSACGGHQDWCHCTGGNACTGSECVDDTWIRNVCTSQGRSYCTNVYGSGKTCCAAGYTCCTTMNGCCQGGGGPTNTPHNPPNDTATPTSTTNPVCQNIKVYKGGTQVTDLTTLKAGDDVVLAVKGNLTPSKAHFRVNGKKPSDANTAGWDETTTKNGSNEWTLNYTIPDGVADFVIEGEVYTNGAWH